MPAWVYILKCVDESYYVGSTGNLALRLAQHQAGEGCTYTQCRLPVDLVFHQEFQTDQEAFVGERQIKGWSRAKKEALIHQDFDTLVRLSKSRQASEDIKEADHPEPHGPRVQPQQPNPTGSKSP
jgi:putative endonuclease